VVIAPRGAHPGACVNAYGIDREHIETYLSASKTEEGFSAWLSETVLGKTEEEYLAFALQERSLAGKGA
jgi:glutaconate CoA-transferase subunit A